jgi:hypothetical protein
MQFWLQYNCLINLMKWSGTGLQMGSSQWFQYMIVSLNEHIPSVERPMFGNPMPNQNVDFFAWLVLVYVILCPILYAGFCLQGL